MAIECALPEYDGFSAHYGASYSVNRSRFFKRMSDLLGGGAISDLDGFVDDTDNVGSFIGNNVLSRGRKVGEGDEFGYNYTMRRTAATLYGSARRQSGRLDLTVAARLCSSASTREGHYKKECRPDGYGRSRPTEFTTLAVKAAALFRAGRRANLAATLYYAEREPFYTDSFLSPETSNDLVADLRKIKCLGFESSARFTFGAARLSIDGYADYSFDRTEITRFYNDLQKVYCDMAASKLARLSCGVEFAAETDLTDRLSVTALAASALARYTSAARIDIWDDAYGTASVRNSTADLRGRAAVSSPQLLSSLRLSYRTRRSWRLSVEAAVAGLRVVAANPFYHTPMVAAAAEVSDTLDEFTSTKRLPQPLRLTFHSTNVSFCPKAALPSRFSCAT